MTPAAPDPAPDLESRLRILEDHERIRSLKALYCHYCNTGWDGAGSDPDAAADLFTDDAVYDTPMTGALQGKVAIRQMMRDFGLRFAMAVHLATTPRIRVEGDTAEATWQGLNALLTPAGQALWSGGSYEEQYVRTAAGWRFGRIRRRSAFLAPYDRGWGEVRDVARQVRDDITRPVPGDRDGDLT
ncbi:nuclear transport factor 2 family protein [Nocardioides humi]|uniref:SnoaL-like domain-containing protein n=1 Tax=Nocardioides humi TaxID=449461 RepID=A0ABN2BDS2_9ACTN|nr:nuclear transport factor 2 family protein [Nocardioides humi]